jgi:hypothetical protein
MSLGGEKKKSLHLQPHKTIVIHKLCDTGREERPEFCKLGEFIVKKKVPPSFRLAAKLGLNSVYTRTPTTEVFHIHPRRALCAAHPVVFRVQLSQVFNITVHEISVSKNTNIWWQRRKLLSRKKCMA